MLAAVFGGSSSWLMSSAVSCRGLMALWNLHDANGGAVQHKAKHKACLPHQSHQILLLYTPTAA